MKISSSNSSISSIRESYKQLGGDFWVATIPSSEEGQQQINTSCIGLIGLCRITSNDGAPFIPKTGETAVATFEIKRLVVNAEYRKLGVGKSLLLKTIQYIKYHLYSHESLFSQPEQKLVARLIAVTPTIMEAANQFYLACGFELLEEKKTHKMSFKTYSKDILII
jgi:GNAT superfamily N-acetyltransferase